MEEENGLNPIDLDPTLRFGFITSFLTRAEGKTIAKMAENLGFDSVWVGDHMALPVPLLDPFLQLTQLAAHSTKLLLGTGVYLLPLRHPMHAAKQVSSLDHLCEGRLIFGVGVGGEVPADYASCGISIHERGARLNESIPLVRDLLAGKSTTGAGPFYHFSETILRPAALQSSGPPIWCGGRAPAALARMGRMADGWLAYLVTPERFQDGLQQISASANQAGRTLHRFGTGLLLFTRLGKRFETTFSEASTHLSQRFSMDFEKPTRRYAAVGRPEDIAERIHAFMEAGVRHVVLDMIGSPEERSEQLEWFATEVIPLLGGNKCAPFETQN